MFQGGKWYVLKTSSRRLNQALILIGFTADAWTELRDVLHLVERRSPYQARKWWVHWWPKGMALGSWICFISSAYLPKVLCVRGKPLLAMESMKSMRAWASVGIKWEFSSAHSSFVFAPFTWFERACHPTLNCAAILWVPTAEHPLACAFSCSAK